VFYEVSRYGTQIAQRLFDDYKVNVQIADTQDNFGPESFDAIFSLDVLEHVPSPPDMVRDLSKLLRPGGFFVVSAPFYAVHPNWPTHLKCNKKYSGRTVWLEKAGQMKLIDGRPFANPLAFQKHNVDGQDMFSLPLRKRFSLGLGGLFLRFSGLFPSLILGIALLMRSRDSQLQRFTPEGTCQKMTAQNSPSILSWYHHSTADSKIRCLNNRGYCHRWHRTMRCRH